jgi:hypothetical protein
VRTADIEALLGINSHDDRGWIQDDGGLATIGNASRGSFMAEASSVVTEGRALLLETALEESIG